MTEKQLIKITDAHLLGYIHGKELGYEANPYDPEDNPKETWAYRLGYERGVAAYCEEVHPEDIDDKQENAD